MNMQMSANLLAEKLGSRVINSLIPESVPGFSVIEFVLETTCFLPGRAYVIENLAGVTFPTGCILLTVGPVTDIPGCAVIACSGDIDAIYTAALEVLDNFRRFSDDLTDLMESDSDIQILTDSASDYLQNQLIIIDRSMQILAFSQLETTQPDENWDYICEHRRLPDQVIDRLASLYRQTKSSDAGPIQRLKTGTELYGIPNVHVDLISRDIYLGWLVLVANRSPLLSGALDLLAQLAKPFSHLMKIHHEETKPNLAFNEYYWQELLAGRLENCLLIQAMIQEKKWQENDFYRVICLSGTADSKTAVSSVLPKGIVLLESSMLTVILHSFSSTDYDNAVENLKPLMKEHGLFAGVSDLAEGVGTLPDLRIQAGIALQSALGTTKEDSMRFGDLAIDQLLLSTEQKSMVSAFIHPAIRRMAAAGTAKSMKNVRTLMVYLENERQLQPSAKQLFVHKNTLLYRINKMEQEYGLQLAEPRERLRILLSIKLLLLNNQTNL